MGALIRRFGRFGRTRTAVMGALALGLLLGTALAFGLASSSADLPFALSAARPPTPTSTVNEQGRTIYQNITGPSGCGTPAPAAAGQSINATLSVGGDSRDYRLHVPRTYAPDERTPLLLAFHAHGMTAAGFERYSRLSQLADTRGFLVAYPQGVRGADGQTGWNTFRHRDPNTDDVGFANALITHLQETLCVDPQRIYATGFSNGGGFVSVLACDLSTRIAAFAPDAGDYYPQPGGCHPAHPVSVLEIHGTADTVNPYNGSTQLNYVSVGQWLQDWATRDACIGQSATRPDAAGVMVETWSDCQDATTVAHIRLIGIGHVWLAQTGSSTPTTSQGTGSHEVGFDTATAVWDFLSTQSLPTGPSVG